jgi:hypothetical protein
MLKFNGFLSLFFLFCLVLFCFVFVVLGVELRVLCLSGSHSTTWAMPQSFVFLRYWDLNLGPTPWATPPVLLVLGFFKIGSCELLIQAGFKPQSSWSVLPEWDYRHEPPAPAALVLLALVIFEIGSHFMLKPTWTPILLFMFPQVSGMTDTCYHIPPFGWDQVLLTFCLGWPNHNPSDLCLLIKGLSHQVWLGIHYFYLNKYF